MKRISLALDDELYERLELATATLGEVNRSRLAASLMAEKSPACRNPSGIGIVLVYVREVCN
jgi:metal-responsive CopG/Arc/MetJ family transcriptional regulator